MTATMIRPRIEPNNPKSDASRRRALLDVRAELASESQLTLAGTLDIIDKMLEAA